MPSHIDPAMLTRFVQMARSSLPQLRANIAHFLQDATQREALEDAYQGLQPLKDAVHMLGLVPLHAIVASVTEMIEDLAAAPLPDETARGACLLSSLDQIEPYLESLLVKDGNEGEMVSAAVRSFRRFKGLPEAGDEAAVEALSAAASGGQLHSRQTDNTPVGRVAPPADDVPTPPVAAMPEDDISAELREGFLLEAEELLDNIGRTLPDIGAQPEQRDALQQVRRSVHTLKGAAGVIGLRSVSQLAHRMEDVLDDLYTGHLPLTPQTKGLLFATFDTLDDFLRDKGGQGNFEQVAQPLYDAYTAILGGAATAAPPVAAAAPVTPANAETHTPGSLAESEASPDSTTSASPPPADLIRVPLARLDGLVRLVSELVISRSVYERHLAHLVRQVEELDLSIDRLRRISTTIETQYEVSTLFQRVW